MLYNNYVLPRIWPERAYILMGLCDGRSQHWNRNFYESNFKSRKRFQWRKLEKWKKNSRNNFLRKQIFKLKELQQVHASGASDTGKPIIIRTQSWYNYRKVSSRITLKVLPKQNFRMWDFRSVIKFQPYLETLHSFIHAYGKCKLLFQPFNVGWLGAG